MASEVDYGNERAQYDRGLLILDKRDPLVDANDGETALLPVAMRIIYERINVNTFVANTRELLGKCEPLVLHIT